MVPQRYQQSMRIVDCLFMQKFGDIKPDWWNIWSEHERPHTAWADHMVEKVVPWSTMPLGSEGSARWPIPMVLP